MLQKLLHILGIPETEAKAFISLAELGKAPAAVLAKRCQIPRTTIYAALNNLVAKGLVSVDNSHEPVLFVSNKPEALLRLVEDEKRAVNRAIQEKESAASQAIPLLEPYFKGENYSVPRLRFFEGEAAVRSMLHDNCRIWQESLSRFDFTWWGYQDHHFVETYRDWLELYWSYMLPKEQIKLFSNVSETERRLKKQVNQREIKAVPKKYQFSSTIWVVGEFVITIMTRQAPHYAFQLQDRVFAANQRYIFQFAVGFALVSRLARRLRREHLLEYPRNLSLIG